MQRKLWTAALAGLTALTFVSPGVVEASAEQGKGQAKGQQQGKGNSEQAPKGKGYAKGHRSSFYPPGITQNPWFSNTAVRQELRLTDEQFANLNKAWARSWNDYQTGVKGLSDEQYAKRMTDLTIRFNQSFDRSLNGMLTTEQQMSRYNQLNFQRGGYNFLDNNAILTQLNLNQQQLTQLQNAQAQFNANMDRIDWSDAQQSMSSYYGQLPKVHETVNGILTQEQRLTWDRLCGQPFNFLVNANTAVPGDVNGTVQGNTIPGTIPGANVTGNATIPGVANGTFQGHATVPGTIQTTGNLNVPGTLHQIPGSIPNAATGSANLGLGMSGQAGFNQGNYGYGRYGWYPGRWLFRGRR